MVKGEASPGFEVWVSSGTELILHVLVCSVSLTVTASWEWLWMFSALEQPLPLCQETSWLEKTAVPEGLVLWSWVRPLYNSNSHLRCLSPPPPVCVCVFVTAISAALIYLSSQTSWGQVCSQVGPPVCLYVWGSTLVSACGSQQTSPAATALATFTFKTGFLTGLEFVSRLGWQARESQGPTGLHLSSAGITSMYHQAQIFFFL